MQVFWPDKHVKFQVGFQKYTFLQNCFPHFKVFFRISNTRVTLAESHSFSPNDDQPLELDPASDDDEDDANMPKTM